MSVGILEVEALMPPAAGSSRAALRLWRDVLHVDAVAAARRPRPCRDTMIATCWNQRSLLRESAGTGRPRGPGTR